MKVKINPVFKRQLLDIEADIYVNIGGRYSGKTYSICQAVVLAALNATNKKQKLKIVIVRKIYATIRDSVFEELLTVIGDMGLEYKAHYSYTVSPLRIIIGTATILFKGLDIAGKIKGLSGVHYLFIEEASELVRQDLDTLLLSIRGKEIKQKIFLATNPVPTIPGFPHWLQEVFPKIGEINLNENYKYHDEQFGSIVLCKSNYKANLTTGDKIKNLLEGYKYTNPNLYQMWVMGDFTKLEGLVFDKWDIVEKLPEGLGDKNIGYGLDFGFSIDPAACVKVWLHGDDIYVQEILYKTNLTNTDLYNNLTAQGIASYDIILADSAEPKSIEDLYRKGFRGIRGVKKRANYKEDMVNRLRSYKIWVVGDSPNLKRELSMYCWAKDKEGNQLPKLQDGNDHLVDAFIMRMHDYLGDQKMQTAEFSVSDLGL